MADLGKKVRVFETGEPIMAPHFIPVKKEQEVEVKEKELVPARTNT